MEARLGLWSLLTACLVSLSLALPSSLVEEIKSSEMRSNKVKRAQPDQVDQEENADRVNYFNKPTSAIKRGTNVKTQSPDLSTLTDWDQVQLYRNNQFNMDNVQSSLFNSPDVPMDDKTIAEYEKGFRYGTNKDKLDEALENAVLKSELYGEPLNQYRYYGTDDRRKRRDTTSSKLRLKRNVDLTPEEALALLALYENNHSPSRDSENYRQLLSRYGKNYGINDSDDFDMNDDETWLDGPVYPHATLSNDIPNNYLFDLGSANGPQHEYKSRWGSFDDAKKKRFIVAKKRTNDPTRMIRYLNGPNENDFNTLSKLLNNQRDSKLNVPVYRRLIL